MFVSIWGLRVVASPRQGGAGRRTRGGIVDARDVVHAANDEVGAVGRPSEIIDLCAARSAHVAGPPRLLVFKAIRAKGSLVGIGRNPEDDVSVVAGRGKQVSWTLVSVECRVV